MAIILLAVLGVAVAQTPTPIPWGPNWYSQFTETAWWPSKGSQSGITGVFKYQFGGPNQRLRVYRADGYWDRFCGTVENSHTPCDHLVINNGNRYLIFPQLRNCCLCCTAANGCGATIPTWFMDSTLYSQTATNVTFLVQGGQTNYYSMTPSGIPLEVNMDPQSDMVYDPTTYTAGTLTDQDFALPTDMGNCNKLCPDSSFCGKMRNQ